MRCDFCIKARQKKKVVQAPRPDDNEAFYQKASFKPNYYQLLFPSFLNHAFSAYLRLEMVLGHEWSSFENLW